jgi:hypothetical protein
MANKSSDGIGIGNSLFWLLFIAINFFSFVYIGLWAFNSENSKVAIMSFIFFMMSIIGIVLSKFEIFDKGTWTENAFMFTVGFIPYVLIAGATKSVLSVTQNTLFASVVNVMPQKIQFVAENFLIPISEELLWMVGMPYIIITILKLASKNKTFKFLGDKTVQLAIVVLICGVTFAEFHVGRSSVAFWISAFLFRSVTIGLVYADILLNIFPKAKLVRALGLGGHMGNNIGNYLKTTGFGQFNAVVLSFPFYIYMLLYGIFIAIFLTFFNRIGDILRIKGKS